MFIDLTGREAIVIAPYRRPYADPISVRRGETVAPDFSRETEITGWVWCKAGDGRSGWAPVQWLEETAAGWRVTRDFSAIELDLAPGDRLRLSHAESGFVWARTDDGREGWAPQGVLKLA